MDTLDCIESRRSIRKFLDVPVEWEKLGKVVEAGMMAPSSGNLQTWKFIVVVDENSRKELAQACLNQNWMARAPVHVVVVSETAKVTRHYGVRGERLYAVQNCAAAVQNMLLAAHDLGLASCWIGAFDENKVQRVLGIPDDVRPQAILPLGYPDEKPPIPKRYKLVDKIFLEKWGNKIRDVDAHVKDYSMVIDRYMQKSKKSLKKKMKEFLK